MTLPEAFVRELAALCRRFIQASSLPLHLAHALVGRAGRVAHVLPLTRPFVTALYAAMSATTEAAAAGARETAPGTVACKRFRHGARMLLRVLHVAGRSPIPCSRDVRAVDPEPADPAQHRIEVDASPWGEEASW